MIAFLNAILLTVQRLFKNIVKCLPIYKLSKLLLLSSSFVSLYQPVFCRCSWVNANTLYFTAIDLHVFVFSKNVPLKVLELGIKAGSSCG